jgi:6-phosphogluconate dehydrogenase
MKIGMIGLGKMGGNLARNMKNHGYEVIVYNRSNSKTDAFVQEGFEGKYSIKDLAEKLTVDDVFWLMVPSGNIVDEVIDDIMKHAELGTLIIDGGNSNYKDTLQRAKKIKECGFRYMDIGTSGGQRGALEGACMMVGGRLEDYKLMEQVLVDICISGGVDYMGDNGAGHYVKMVHNGIEYGMMQAIAEGFEILDNSSFDLDLTRAAKVWQNGSIVSSYLIDKAVLALEKNPDMEGVLDRVDSSGEGLWTLEEALEQKIPAYVIAASLFKRFESNQENRFSNKLLAAMRHEFGGHKLHKEGE